MNNSRLQHLLQFLKEDPNEPFNIYAIATEYRNSDTQKAIEYYERLLDNHKQYVPTYYHAAAVYIELGMPEKAEKAYKNGIDMAKQQHETLALRELQNAYNEFLFDG